MTNFKSGDEVYYAKHKATIIDVINDSFGYRYEIKFKDEGLIPQTMVVIANHITHIRGKDSTKCPYCLNKWKVTKFRANVWRDCITCGKTEEILVKEAKLFDEIEDDRETVSTLGIF